ncbi:ribonuclease HII [Leptospira interrogans serovar Grippotyphosa str. UI 12769]|uniref:Ribonuclease n=7 Tax=Leptospira interrogans TaxID=173 RepID=Q8F3L5_LEPIN|nr:ribonuclease HII [Leptospira interrogans]AAN49585.2 ribonuclease H II [Leptospira interrogans serovar Lai str. 56601]AER02745.1 ribonuclease H II [Leptospira interrogans serovar Lai str. IPAV]EKR43092.1 ribonuclease HII [Leptospira interrogans serovar Grippotyphosa str. UI 08368]EKR54695.1 ribonuclease HII [Leptospira interrogans str. UI 12758]EMM91788.1 ribonuclease HII [Leptospira interrogans serovar Djasiman str. LT1649]
MPEPKLSNFFELEEHRFYSESIPCGIDEAGRGPYAGPLSVALVSFSQNSLTQILEGKILKGLTDSKKLSEKKRESLYPEIIKAAQFSYQTFISPNYIDRKGINRAVLEGILKCTKLINRFTQSKFPLKLLIDGNYNFNRYPEWMNLKDCSTFYIKGDLRIVSIAAASILAKVSRDRYMISVSKKYPIYRFDQHKGYGTKLHEELILLHGLSDIHRRSFTGKFLEQISESNL